MAEQLEFFSRYKVRAGEYVSPMNAGIAAAVFRSRDERFNWQKADRRAKSRRFYVCAASVYCVKIRATKQEPAEEPQQPSLF